MFFFGVLLGMFWASNTSSQGVWKPREVIQILCDLDHVLKFLWLKNKK